MIEQVLRSICESRFRWAIVTIVTFLMGCALLIPLVDKLLGDRLVSQTMSEELVESHQVANTLDEVETRMAAQMAALARMEAKTVTEQSIPEVRKRLSNLAHDNGCTMRKLQMGNPTARDWYVDDNPLLPAPSGNPRPAKTPFTLERWPLSVTLHGSISNLRGLLDHMGRDEMLVHTKSLELIPEGQEGRSVTLQMELWYFALRRKTG